MPGVQTTQILTKGSNECALSSTKRVPLKALQMLTQSVSPLTRDYVQPFPISEGSEQKKSPLALLAATCSSIGKTEAKQESRVAPNARQSPKNSSNSSAVDGRSVINKISTDETKSSFKPYKHDGKESNHNSSSGEKPGFRAPNKDPVQADSLSHSNRSKSPEFRKDHVSSFLPFQYPYFTDSASAHCFYQAQSRMCGMYFDVANQPSGHHSCLKSDCHGNCASMILPPTSLGPTTPAPSIRPILPSPPVSASSTVKSHGLPSSTGRSNPLYPRCNCGYCNQAAPSQEGNLKGIPYPTLPHYHRDYLQTAANCQDPYCTNCKSHILTPGTRGSSPRGCGPHCFHHHYENATTLPGSLSALTPTMSHFYGFTQRPQADQANPFVCNWMQDSKNCGKNFTTSDELLQHLRTHTNSANTASLHTQCNIPGCLCSLKSLSGPSRLSSTRYHPYFFPGSSALHSQSFHSALTPYASPHGISPGSPYKPY